VRQAAHQVQASRSAGMMTVPPLSNAAQPFDVGNPPIREVAQRALTHLAVFTVALAQQDGRR
jgi:hypothetical protein